VVDPTPAVPRRYAEEGASISIKALHPTAAQPVELRAGAGGRRRLNARALVRQAKLGASGRVQGPAESGLPNHSYRVLHL